MVVEEIAARAGERLRKARFVPAETGEVRDGGVRLLLARSQRYMNESGPIYASLAKKHDVLPARLVAVHDEIEIPFGALRLKMGGSTAGHNGLKSLQAALRSPDFYRVRVGIGRPPGRRDPTDFVLSPFSARERDDLPALLADAADAVMTLVTEGLAAAQARHGRGGPPASTA